MKYSIIIPSHNRILAQEAKNCLGNLPVTIFDGTGYPSFSKLINDCIIYAENEIVIIVNHKIRANALHIDEMLNLINKGYGMVCLQNFHFFGFKKDLIRKLGFWDERFVGGNFEDSDYVRRMIAANIGWYDSVGVEVLQMRSTWNAKLAIKFFYKKWNNGGLERLLPDEEYDYDIGEYQGAEFLDLTHTVLSKSNEDYFKGLA